MSNRTVSRIVLAGWLAVALAAPAAAQQPLPQSPMPRAKRPDVRLFIGYGLFETHVGTPDAVPPMTAPIPPAFTAPAGESAQIAVPNVSPVGLAVDIALPVPADRRQPFYFLGPGVFGSRDFGAREVTADPMPLVGGFGPYCAPGIPQLIGPNPRRPDLRAFAQYDVTGFGLKTPPVCPPCPPVRPAGGCDLPGDATKSLAGEAFGQLLRQSGMTLPGGPYLEHVPQYFAPDPVFPLPRELASQGVEAVAPARVPKPGFVGTWCRDVAGKQCVVKVLADHLTLTVSEAHEEGGKVTTANLVLTADYHLTRDGLTAVGLITGVDVSLDGDFPQEDTKPFFDMLTDLQKALEDKPFALTFRTYGDALVIGNVRMPEVSDRVDVQPAGYMAGRFKAAGDKLPKPKPMKPSPGLMAPPGGDTLPPQTIPLPGVVIPSGATVPQMPPPAKPGAVGEPAKDWGWFWLNNRPSHLTPERIHGGIY